MKEEFDVCVDDLTDGSLVNVTIRCDYCGNEFTKPWHRFITERKNELIKKDCCHNCKKHKIMDTSMQKYGVNSVFSLPEVKNKISYTNNIKYGSENPFASETIKQKIKETNIKKYGVSVPTKSEHIKEKARKTCQKKYGVDYYVQNLHLVGENNPRWKGGVKYQRVERSTNEYLQWRKSVYSRDLYTCQCCNSKNERGKSAVKLNAHHICNWNDYPTLRYDVNNGITLCCDCHKLFHSIYGKKNNTYEQILEFLNNHGKKIC